MWQAGYDMPAGRSSRPRSTGCGARSSRSTISCTATRAASSTRSTATRSCRRPARSRRTCSATCGRRSGATCIPSSSRTRASRRSTSRRCSRRSYDAKKMVQMGEAFYTSLGMDPLPATFWERSMFQKPEGQGGRLPRERVGRHVQQRPAHQDVHQQEPGGSRHDPSRARPRLLLPALLQAADPLSERRERRLPRGDRRHDRAVDDAGVPQEEGPARQGRRRTTRPRSTSR